MVTAPGLKSTKRTHFIHQLRKMFNDERPVRKFIYHERPIIRERTARRRKVPKTQLIASTEHDHDILNNDKSVGPPHPREPSHSSERAHLLRRSTPKPPINEHTVSVVADESPLGSFNTVKRIVRERIRPPVDRQSKSIGVQTTPPDRINRATQTQLSFILPAVLRSQYGTLNKAADHRMTILCHEFLLQVQAIYDSPCSIQAKSTDCSTQSNRASTTN